MTNHPPSLSGSQPPDAANRRECTCDGPGDCPEPDTCADYEETCRLVGASAERNHAHVRHMGFELEIAHAKIVAVLRDATPDQKLVVIEHLKPKKLALAVADTFGAAWAVK